MEGTRSPNEVHVAGLNGHFLVKKAHKAFIGGNGGYLLCPVHFGRQIVDEGSMSIFYHEPPFKPDPL